MQRAGALFFLMLETFLKGYERNVFDNENICPVSKAVIEELVLILKPFYIFSLYVQKTDSTIAQVVPMILMTLDQLARTVASSCGKQLISLLTDNVHDYFKYELESPI